jgi:glycosyltransferase involved in cell wall biosynthesis
VKNPPIVASLVVISPVRDESLFVKYTLDAMLAQTVRPQEWLFVDDGSVDDTRAIIESYAADNPWIHVVSRENRGFRQVGAGVIAAFNYGLRRLRSDDYRYIAKLDGDISFSPRYLEIMLDRLESEPDLAAASGKSFRMERGRLVEEFKIDEMVAGQFKLYKRTAFEDIGGFTETILWDGIDIHRCRMKGHRTLSFHHPDARIIHYRQMGSSDSSVLKGRVRLGRGIWFMGYHPLYAVVSGLFRMRERPYLIGGLLIITSYFYAAIRGEPRFEDKEFIKQLQQWQRQRLQQLPRKLIRRLFGATHGVS